MKKSLKFALEGIIEAFRHNINFRRQVLVGVSVMLVGFVLGLAMAEWVALVIVIGLVLMAELINTALEEVVNLVTREHRQEAKIAKDVSAGMVLLAAVISMVVGLFIFIPYLIDFAAS